jgi:hypothetical protein
VLDDDRLHRLGLRLARLGVGRQDLVAGLELADRDRGAGGEQDLGSRAEAVIAAGVDVVPVSSGVGEVAAGVFCGKDASRRIVEKPLQLAARVPSFRRGPERGALPGHAPTDPALSPLIVSEAPIIIGNAELEPTRWADLIGTSSRTC